MQYACDGFPRRRVWLANVKGHDIISLSQVEQMGRTSQTSHHVEYDPGNRIMVIIHNIQFSASTGISSFHQSYNMQSDAICNGS